MALATAPPKPHHAAESEDARQAKALFWSAFSGGRYEDVGEVLVPLTAAYLAYPYDPELALLIAHAHLWRVSERERSEQAGGDPTITDSLVLARYYFEQAQRLDPSDTRIAGWLASCDLALGTVHNEQLFIRRGYFSLKDAWKSHPAFNGFTFGYAMSGTDRASEQFQEGLAAMWSSVRRCTDGRMSPEQPSTATAVPDPAALAEVDPACWNSARAPHNYEGFWWTLALMEAKNGRTQAAAACFQNARASPNYAQWPFRTEMESDEARLDALAAGFAAGDAATEERLVFNAPYACMACHEASEPPPQQTSK